MGIVDRYLRKLNTRKQWFRRTVAILTVLSVLVVLTVSWNLRQTGITLANDACCGMTEHRHTEECPAEITMLCGYPAETPTETAPGEMIPQETDAEETVSQETAPAEMESEETVPEEIVPVETESEETAPAETEPEETVPEEIVPVETEPEETASEETEREVTEPEVTEPEETTEGTEETTEATVETTGPTEETIQEGGEAEHIHSEACYQITYLCGLEEHIHELACYSDVTADLEDWSVWAESVPELTGRISEDIVLVAQSQLGVRESERNFELGMDGLTQNGISRYGQWFGNPYGPWSNMFTAFCLRYAGLTDVPVNSGAEAMRMAWEEVFLYRYAGGYEPVAGDIVFFDKNQNGTAEATGVVVKYFDFVLTVIEGDVDNAVSQQEYLLDDPVIQGYGMTNPGGRVQMFATGAASTAMTVAQSVNYQNNSQLIGNTFVVYTTTSDGRHYAIDGNGNLVEVQISNSGVITADITDPNPLYWIFTKGETYNGQQTYKIQNVSTKIYLHPSGDAGGSPFHKTDWSSYVHNSGGTVRFQGLRQSYYAMVSGSALTITNDDKQATIFKLGKAPSQVTLWLDGTNGNIMSYRGSDNTAYTVYSGVPAQLPSTWKSPTKYQYHLAGWVNIKTGDYYLPGDTITVTENTVLYADWVATTYDIGRYNSQVADTVSTNDFITTHVFDYSSLINLLSSKVNVTVSNSSHSETWSHVETGKVSYKGQDSLNFSFNDHDGSGSITNLNNLNAENKYTGGAIVHEGIYDENTNLGEVLFGTDNLFNPETGEGIVGKHYLGQGDHLFQINNDPNSEYYGYYYYDAKLNAASYNQSEQRFYVYEYLERTSDSANNNDSGKYSDFLPLNSPYINTNGQTLPTYTYNGDNGEYAGTTHFSYDARYDSNSSSAKNAKANLWFGMRTDVIFDLPDVPGKKNSNGEYGNKDIYGNDMHFKFTGDDDVWILLNDEKVILDLGGIHQAVDGDINFSTGEVRVNGVVVDTLEGIKIGENKLSILYLERGSSMSNCAIYFNLAPQFSMTLQKEDVLTQELLDGAIFGFYYDQACTAECALWPDRESYRNDDEGTHLFTVTDGELYVWGLSPSRTYYIREEQPPNDSSYEVSHGVIRLTLDKNGLNSYSATILPPVDKNGNVTGSISHGFTVHGFRIDEENQAAYVSITNAQNWVTETTSIYVEKKWRDSENHSGDAVTVYLNVTDAKGNVRRLREITLSQENDWKYEWTNLPKYIQADDGTESDIPVSYSVSEAYVPGYMAQVKELENGEYEDIVWVESNEFTSNTNGATFLLKTEKGYLATVAENSDALCFIESEAEARSNPLARWVATVSSGKVKLTNEKKQVLTYSNSTYRIAKSGNQNLTFKNNLLYYSSTTYMGGTFNKNNYLESKRYSSQALKIYPMMEKKDKYTVSLSGYGYRIDNTPLSTETSLQVKKVWDHPTNDFSLYEKEQITVRLLANGVDTGRAETVSLKNGWVVTFNGLPYLDAEGEPIRYTVVEIMESKDWIPVYGEITVIGNSGGNPTYETTVTNYYRWVDAVELPSTGGIGMPLYILCGMTAAAVPLVYGLSLRRKERRSRA